MSILMKFKRTFFITTHFTELCGVRYQTWKKQLPCKKPVSHVYRSFHVLSILGASFSQGSPLQCLLLLQLPNSVLLVLYHRSPLMANTIRLLTSLYKKFKATCIFLSKGTGALIGVCLFCLDNTTLFQNLWQGFVSSKSLLFCHSAGSWE